MSAAQLEAQQRQLEAHEAQQRQWQLEAQQRQGEPPGAAQRGPDPGSGTAEDLQVGVQ